ncbi:hypothetical protein K2173_010599 [Erythroxylum novogranatense]|uniref:Uncharacterized protein n=1 Tax=Erythroxylum novogranatense TaxID=1862640 RepID=A0AAV8TFT8_9ROSI|nr:hypothetical protein K2173_010599 [Erythroxylum novogranatense]
MGRSDIPTNIRDFDGSSNAQTNGVFDVIPPITAEQFQQLLALLSHHNLEFNFDYLKFEGFYVCSDNKALIFTGNRNAAMLCLEGRDYGHRFLLDTSKINEPQKTTVKRLPKYFIYQRKSFTTVELRMKPHVKNFLFKLGLINNSWYAEIVLDGHPGAVSSNIVTDGDMEKAMMVNMEIKIKGLAYGIQDQPMLQASKQRLHGQDVPKVTRKARIIQWLTVSWSLLDIKKLQTAFCSFNDTYGLVI